MTLMKTQHSSQYMSIFSNEGCSSMETLVIQATKFTPEICLDVEKGLISMCGKSYPENTFDFYAPVMAWIEEYFKVSNRSIDVEMEIIYFNSSSSKLFYDFFDTLDEAREEGHKITVKWIYDEENESALEAGEDFSEDFEALEFALVMKS